MSVEKEKKVGGIVLMISEIATIVAILGASAYRLFFTEKLENEKPVQ